MSFTAHLIFKQNRNFFVSTESDMSCRIHINIDVKDDIIHDTQILNLRLSHPIN